MKREQLAPVFTVSEAGLVSLLPIKALLTTAPREGTGVWGPPMQSLGEATEKADTYCWSSCTSILQHKSEQGQLRRREQDQHVSHKNNTEGN